MELKEAFDIIDATLGMFRSFAAEIDNRDPKENFLATPVRSEVQTVMTVVDGDFNPDIECKEYYNDVDGDREYKMYIVNIRPVCNYIVNEWPSSKAKKIRKLLYVVFRECLDICEEPLKGIIDVAIDEGYSYHMRYNASSQNSRTIESVMLDTIHEMYHALGLTEYAEPESEDPSDDKGGITEDLANSIDWVKLTDNFNLDKIRDIIKTVGRSKKEKKIIVKAIYDAESATGNMYKIPYSVDKLLNDLYMENDENHRSLFDASYDASTETLNLDILMKQAIDEYMKKHTATEEDIDDIFKDDQSNIENQKEENEQLLQQITALKSEVNKLSKENADLKGNLSNALYEVERLKKDNNNFQKYLGTPKIVLTNNSNFARVVQAMVSARYFKRANGDETNATEVGGMLLKIFGVSNTWKSVLQKAFSREYPLKTFDELRDAGQKYWEGRAGLTKEIRKKGKK